jgi:hypothetical protein
MANSTFQHRHYKAIADVLADMRDTELDLTAPHVLDEFEDRLVRLFRGDNVGFSPDRFRAAARRAPDMHGKDKVR